MVYALRDPAPLASAAVLLCSAAASLGASSASLAAGAGCFRDYGINAKRYFALMHNRKKNTRTTGTNKEAVTVTLNGVSFSYDGKDNVLHGVSLTIHPGERLAIVGENGSGKTALAKLILQLYRPCEGSLVISGENGTVDSCRATDVLQDYVRYQLSVRDNIALGEISKLDNDEAIKAAYRAVCGNELPFALDEILGKQFGERDLSGGEWQRLAIARACFREAPLIVLDEPNASIDAFAEAAMIKRMFEMAKDKTCVFITHRLTTTALADRIIVMKDGRLCEEGTHEELMMRNGEYARMHLVQSQMYI